MPTSGNAAEATPTEFHFNGRAYHALYPDLLRALSGPEAADLEQSIRENGVQGPILVDDEGGIIDGYHRCSISQKIGLATIPTNVIRGRTEEQKRALAFEMNDCRRQQSDHELQGRRKTREEKRSAVAAALIADPSASDRAIAERVGDATGEKPSHHTVGRVRAQLGNSGEIAQLPTTKGRDGKSRPASRGPKLAIPEPVKAEAAPERESDPTPFMYTPARVDDFRPPFGEESLSDFDPKPGLAPTDARIAMRVGCGENIVSVVRREGLSLEGVVEALVRAGSLVNKSKSKPKAGLATLVKGCTPDPREPEKAVEDALEAFQRLYPETRDAFIEWCVRNRDCIHIARE